MTPQLRFPEFNDDWQVKKLGDLSNTVNGLTYSPSNIRKSGVLVLRSSNIKHGQLDFTDSVFVDENLRYNESKKGDILICVRNGSQSLIGKNTYIDKELPKTTHGAFMSVLRSDESRFIYQLFQTNNYKKQVSADLGARINSINNAQLLKYKFSFPSKPEQEKIADFLTAVDERIAVGEKKLELLETYKRGVMQKIFSQQIRFKDENGKPYPDWEEKKLGEIGETYSGLTGKSGIDFGVGANFITYMQIFSSSKISQNFGKVRINPNERQNTVKYGDIFFTTSSETPEETGYTSVLLDSPVDTYLNSFCFGYRADKKILSPEFARYLFHSSNVRSSIIRLAQGSTRYNISKVQMMKMTISIPTKEEQQKIANFLTTLDEKITAEKSKLTAAKQFKKALLQRMFA